MNRPPLVGASANYAFPVGPAGGGLSGTYPNPTVATGSLTLAGDVTGAANANKVAAISGPTPIAITPNEFRWVAGAAPLIDQAQQASNIATSNLTIKSQVPFGGATGAGIAPGNIVLNIPSPDSGTVYGWTEFQNNGTRVAAMGSATFGTTYGSLWLGNNAPTNGQEAITGNSAITLVNGTSTLNLGVGGTTYVSLNSSNALASFGVPISGKNGGLAAMSFSVNSPIAIGAGGTFTLSTAQATNPVTPLTGSLVTNNAIVVVPNTVGFYLFDLSGLTSSSGTLQFQSGSAVCVATVIGAALGNTLAIVNSRGSNTIACNY